MARMQTRPPEPSPSSIHSITLAEEEATVLKRLSQEASDFLGRTISSSAVVRALLRQIGKQDPGVIDALFLEIERELKAGKLWGKKRR